MRPPPQDLGLCLYYQRKLTEAMGYYERACRIIVRNFGERHPDLAVPAFNVAPPPLLVLSGHVASLTPY